MDYPGRDFSPAAIADRLFNRPLAVTPSKLNAIMGVVGPRFDVARLHTGNQILTAEVLAAAAKSERIRVQAMSDRVEHRIFDLRGDAAVIHVRGTLVQRNGLHPESGMTGYDGIARKMEAAEADPAVAGIIFDIDSPGGEVAGCFDLATQIASATKPTFSVLTEMACSAAYALASATDEIWIPRTGFAGSIGVIAQHTDFSRALDDAGIDVTLIYAGAHKADGNPYEPLPDDVAAEIGAEIQAVYAYFADLVGSWRGIGADAVRATESRVLRADEALATGLVDHIASPAAAYDAIARKLDGSGGPADRGSSNAAGRTDLQNGDKIMPKNRKAQARHKAKGTENDEAMGEDDDDYVDPNAAASDDDETSEGDDKDERAAGSDDDENAEGGDDDERAEGDDDGEKATVSRKALQSARARGRVDALEIVEICHLAGQPTAALDFLTKGMSAAQVRKALQSRKADQSAQSHVSTHHNGADGKPADHQAGWKKAHEKAAGRRRRAA